MCAALDTNLGSIFYLLCGLGQVTYTLSAFFFCEIRTMKIPPKATERIK